MGINGLLKKLDNEFDDSIIPLEIIEQGSVLLIDGNGLMFHIYDEFMSEFYNLKIQKQYGGNYFNVAELLSKEIYRLRTVFGLQLVFFFDGPTSYLKGDTAEKRRKSINEEWLNLFNFTHEDVIIDQDKLPLPVLTKEQLLISLNELNVKVVFCKYEADQDIALACTQGNLQNKNKKFYCCSGDR
jgi:hypothetical protein